MPPRAHWPGLHRIRLTGADALDWLQGQCTQDLRGMEPGEVRLAMLARNTGQLEALLVIHASAEGLDVYAEPPEPLMDRVRDFVIMEDVAAQLDPRPVCWEAGEGDGAPLTLDIPGCLAFADAEPDEARLLAAGWPRVGADTSAKTLCPELGALWVDRAISYRKGCYTGQEVIMRIHSRGRTHRTWMLVLAKEPLKAGAPVEVDGAPVGEVLRCMEWQGRWLASAHIKNAAAVDGQAAAVSGKPAVLRFPPVTAP